MSFNFNLSKVDWKDLERGIVRAPQLILQNLQDNEIKREQSSIEHVRVIINSYEVLQEYSKRHNKSILEFLRAFKGIVEHMGEMLGSEISLNVRQMLLVKTDQLEVLMFDEVCAFKDRFEKALSNVLKTMKPMDKVLKENNYIESDYKRYSEEYKKLKSKSKSKVGLAPKEHKRMYEVEKKAKDNEIRLQHIDQCMQKELPLMISLNDKIVNNFGLLLYIFILNIYRQLWDSIKDIQSFYPVKENTYGMIFYENILREFKANKQNVQVEIEKLGIVNFRQQSIEAMLMKPTVGRALYNFEGSKTGDLKFSKGQKVTILEKRENGWWRARLGDGTEGEIPYNYFEYI